METRIRDLQVGSAIQLELIYSMETNNDCKKEKELHQKFWKYHYRGEWFEYSDEIKDYINLCKDTNHTIKKVGYIEEISKPIIDIRLIRTNGKLTTMRRERLIAI